MISTLNLWRQNPPLLFGRDLVFTPLHLSNALISSRLLVTTLVEARTLVGPGIHIENLVMALTGPVDL